MRLYLGSTPYSYRSLLHCLFAMFIQDRADSRQEAKQEKERGIRKDHKPGFDLGSKKGFAQTLLSQLTFCQIRIASANHFSDLHMPTIDIEGYMEEDLHAHSQQSMIMFNVTQFINRP